LVFVIFSHDFIGNSLGPYYYCLIVVFEFKYSQKENLNDLANKAID